MLRTISLGAEFLGNGLAAFALLRLVKYKLFDSPPRQWLFPMFLFSMAAFCFTNVGYSMTVALPHNPYIGWGSEFETVAETVQVLTFLYITPVLLTLIAVTHVLEKRGFKFIARKVRKVEVD